jgi:cytochrome b subunit of formate dehydrogenase
MDNHGQVNIVGTVVIAIAGIIGIVIFAAVFAGLNTAQVSSSAVSILNVIDLLLAAVIVLGILGGLAYVSRM